MFKRILVPLDGSELAEIALPYAEDLAGAFGAEIVLLHVLESDDSEYKRMHESYLQEAAERVTDSVRKRAAGDQAGAVRVEAVIAEGHPAEQIIDRADDESVDLIAMATHGRSGVRRWVMGSVADKVVSATQAPVTLVKAKAEGTERRETPYGSLLVPLDGSPEAETVLSYVEALGTRMGSRVVLLSVVPGVSAVYAFPGETVQFPYTEADVQIMKTDAETYLASVAERLEEKGLRPESRVVAGDTAEEIILTAERAHADLVAMSTHGRSGVSRWAFGSVADKVLRGVDSPLFLVRTASTGS